jgi:hypothetical protein
MDNNTLLFLLASEIEQAFHTWDAQQPPRTGLHASSVLESDSDFCTRQHVLAEVFPAERQQKEQYWKVLAMFLNGWSIHEKWQKDILFPMGIVQSTGFNDELEFELDLTHIDNTTNIKFSPDAIIEYAGQIMPVEIKGINHDDFAGCPETYTRTFKNGGYAYELAQEARQGVKDATLEEAMARNKSIRSAVPQLNLYLHLLGLQKGIILAEDKNTQDFMLWVWTYDPQLAVNPVYKSSLVTAANTTYTAIGILPARICKTVNDSRAKRCPFRDACFKEGR